MTSAGWLTSPRSSIVEAELELDGELGAIGGGQRRLQAVVAGVADAARAVSEAVVARSPVHTDVLMRSADEGIIGLDAGGRIVFVNPAAERMLGRRAGRLVGTELAECLLRTSPVVDPASFDVSPIVRTLADGLTRRFDGELARTDGSLFPAETVVATTHQDGEAGGAVVVFRDMTERYAIERMKDEFVSVIGHEMRTPLTSILGSLGLLAGGAITGVPPQAQRMLEIAVSNADRLVRLIDDILDLERIESGRMELRREPQVARELLEATFAVVSALAREAGIQLSVNADHVCVAADGYRMIQALTNLAGNAIKFTAPGRSVELLARREGDWARFEVRDRGRGIPPERLHDIFERFEQVDASDAREKGGTGLGLTIARRIVEEHEGRIWAVSELGYGSTFIIELPVYVSSG